MEELKSDSKIWAIAAHLVPLAGVPLLGPLVVYLVKKDDDPFVRNHAAEALNFQISVTIYAFVSAILVLLFVGILMLIALGILVLVASILAAIKASNGELYRYPLTIRLVS